MQGSFSPCVRTEAAQPISAKTALMLGLQLRSLLGLCAAFGPVMSWFLCQCVTRLGVGITKQLVLMCVCVCVCVCVCWQLGVGTHCVPAPCLQHYSLGTPALSHGRRAAAVRQALKQ